MKFFSRFCLEKLFITLSNENKWFFKSNHVTQNDADRDVIVTIHPSYTRTTLFILNY